MSLVKGLFLISALPFLNCCAHAATFYAERFGAKGDSVTDDTVKLQMAIDSLVRAPNGGGGKLVLRANAKYLISKPLVIALTNSHGGFGFVSGLTIEGEAYGYSDSPSSTQILQ